ncbi:MAG: hypothetical protein ACT4QC_14990 [Planctomycetaceae bacterium]
MIELKQTADAYVLQAGPLQLSFARRGDRWRHTISVGGNDQAHAILISREGPPDTPAPPSPAYQDLRVEPIASDVYEVQLFGQAGGGVYSAAVRLHGPSRSISFDLHARAQRAGALLCTTSRYVLADGVTLVNNDQPNSILFGIDGRELRLRLVAESSAPIGPSAVMESTHGAEERIIAVAAVNAGRKGGAAAWNARWRYRIQLAGQP